MAEIHGLVYFILGLFVSGISYYINNKYDQSNLLFFVYVGIGMVLIGFVKLIWQRLKKKESIAKHNNQTNMQRNHQNNPMQSVQQQFQKVEQQTQQQIKQVEQQAQKAYHKFCHKCGSAVHHTSNFCHVCGQRLFK